jgi:GntR family transcriptional regulator
MSSSARDARSSPRLSGHARRLPREIARAIVGFAEERSLGHGDALPSEPDLAKLFDVGRTTVREALAMLENDGWIERSQGTRTTLTSLFHRPVLGLEVLEPLEELAARQGWTCGTEEVTFVVEAATDEEALRLRVEAGTTVTRLTRVKTIDDEPLALMRSVVPERTAFPDELRRGFRDSITRLMATTRPLRFAESEISAEPCDAELASMLGLVGGAPVVVLEELFFSDAPDPLLWNTNWIVPGRIRLEMLRRFPRPSSLPDPPG